jgi:hypothetical protein
MADLNKLLNDVRSRGDKVSDDLQGLFVAYEMLYKESHDQFISERNAANGKLDGLEEFYRLIGIIRRNRDVVGSLQRGLRSLRPVKEFSFVEEDIEVAKAKEQQKKKRGRPPKPVVAPEPTEPGHPETSENPDTSLKDIIDNGKTS